MFLLAADSMYASGKMSGRFKVISLPNVIAHAEIAIQHATQPMIVDRPTVEVQTAHFVETDVGVGDIEHFRIGMIDYLLIGLEDGSLHLYNLTKNFGNSYSLQKPLGNDKNIHSSYD
jgi:hypothetical protein